ncbi:MAG: metal ABC transporter ATP-binding protein [Sandaracinaceae bacterium]|nr:metal ABC transporter ATP-binding protein [Myxococcales bacterium]MCB9657128.1 metal ABC transporter ATP-binding protein [Sandaracinaceae bacterium]
MSGRPSLGSLTKPDREKEPCVFEVSGVTKRYGDHLVLDDVSFWIPKGEFLCLCGPNGAGKSTLLKIILGLEQPDAGEVRIGQGATAGTRATSREVGYVPQHKAFHRDFPARVEDLIVANLRGRWPYRIRESERAAAEAALARVGGQHLWGKEISKLSGGQMQRVFLARALVTQPALLILDEPTAGVDIRGRDEFVEILFEISRSDELAAILVTHHMGEVARTAERVLYLEHRVVAWGLPDELLGRPDLLAISDPGARSTRWDPVPECAEEHT